MTFSARIAQQELPSGFLTSSGIKRLCSTREDDEDAEEDEGNVFLDEAIEGEMGEDIDKADRNRDEGDDGEKEQQLDLKVEDEEDFMSLPKIDHTFEDT